MKKILAFTLAETLIVMGIIGIVSALTLPNLNSSTGEKEKIAKVKKIYQNVNDALGPVRLLSILEIYACFGLSLIWYLSSSLCMFSYLLQFSVPYLFSTLLFVKSTESLCFRNM